MLHYRVEIKREAVRLVLEEHLTYAAVGAKLEIRKAERIEAWVGMYRREGEDSFDKPVGRPLKLQGGEAGVNPLTIISCRQFQRPDSHPGEDLASPWLLSRTARS